ncbi:hypothetical protein NLG97_g962 [Lecanicillium saksenae]|uniref:Uncharacterized protein n=1 Tax=Lecanicillium saksenae TaxID=468837 RepID=A0ACC1R7P4_9HYPO|nr:hypothetical protein NLG97_g962 [Lecanicillium saksenae]
MPAPVPEPASRQRRWTPRVRTGCQTCRLRHVKCDERRPTCKKCSIAQRECVYLLNSHLPAEGAKRDAPVKLASKSVLQQETQPPEWDFMQAVRYYYLMIHGDLPTSRHPPFHSYTENQRIGITGNVLADRLCTIAKNRGKLMRFGEDSALQGLWASYMTYAIRYLGVINEIIRKGPKSKETAFWHIYMLQIQDRAVYGGVWAAHMNGYLAYIDCMGGLTAVLDRPDSPSFSGIFQTLFTEILRANTASPATMQVTRLYKFTEDEIRTVIGDRVIHNMPYPVDLWIAIFNISRLRQRVAAGARLTFDEARSLFNAIDEFDIKAWSEKASLENEDLTPEMTQIIQACVRLYGILTLPPRTVLAAYPQAGTYRKLKVQERRRLVELLENTLPVSKRIIAFDWLLVVAGVAAGKDDEDEDEEALGHQAFVGKWFHQLTIDRTADVISIGTLNKLRQFWRSGKSGWEDCFYEPTCL